MSDIIRLLPDSVANQIAAGEVIQRPASVVKELAENAVDAGASQIRIIIVDAGRTLIQVIDDGKGMSETDARMAFERHFKDMPGFRSVLAHYNGIPWRGASFDLRYCPDRAQDAAAGRPARHTFADQCFQSRESGASDV